LVFLFPGSAITLRSCDFRSFTDGFNFSSTTFLSTAN